MVAERIDDAPITRAIRATETVTGPVTGPAALYDYAPLFMAALVDPAGKQLSVERHHVRWLEELNRWPLLCLLAPRDHGKSWTLMAYVLWRMWRHNRNRETGEPLEGSPQGIWRVVVFSATQTQAREFAERLMELLDANGALFGTGVVPQTGMMSRTRLRGLRSKMHVRLATDADAEFRSFRGAARGLHPNEVVCDDVVDDRNSATDYQRRKTRRHFDGVIMPLVNIEHGGRVTIVGTPQHRSDLLMGLRPSPDSPSGFRWVRYRAYDDRTGRVLWEKQHSRADLLARRRRNPVEFSREFQCDPRDDQASLFPFSLTTPALTRGKDLILLDRYRRPFERREFVVLGADMALSDQVGRDYCVIRVMRIDRDTGQRTLIWAEREIGWPLPTQLERIADACVRYGVDLGCVEHNAFQRWLHDELRKDPRTNNRIVGHNTGAEKSSPKDGIPSLVVLFHNGLITYPTGDERSRDYAVTEQLEFQAYGWGGGAAGTDRSGRQSGGGVEGSGEHDDTVVASWLTERAYRIMLTLLSEGPAEDHVSMEDVGIERVRIGDGT